MNLSLAVFLISQECRAIQVCYTVHNDGSPKELYTFKSFDQSLKADDYVIVPTDTRHGMTVCKIVEVDIEPDFDAVHDFKWIIGKVDLADFEDIKSKEAEAILKIRKAEKRSMREKLRKSLEEDTGVEFTALPMYQPPAKDEPIGIDPAQPNGDAAEEPETDSEE